VSGWKPAGLQRPGRVGFGTNHMATQMSSPSSKPSRGAVLTVFAVLAISNFSKPFHLDSRAGFVFFGAKTSGIANDILGPAFGVWLLVYAIGIWRMGRWALPLGYAYAAYVIANLVLFTIRTGVVPGGPSTRGAIIYLVIAIGVSAGSVVLLRRRQAQLT
jgi:hypothetical protein